MDKFGNLFLVTVKSRHLIPIGAPLLIKAIVKYKRNSARNGEGGYLGDNLPLHIIERIKNG